MMASSRRPTPALAAAVGLLFVLGCSSTIRGSVSEDGGVEQGDATTTPSASHGSRADGSAASEGGSPAANAGIYCQFAGTTCTCTAPDGRPGGGPECSNATVENSVCCADAAWPGAATTCACRRYGCGDDGSGTTCVCDTSTATKTGTSCQPGTGATCCAWASGQYANCRCQSGGGSCTDGPINVTACTAAAQVCPTGQRRVTTCSL